MTNPRDTTPTRAVDAWELRCLFNRAKYWARACAGEFDIRSHKAKPPQTGYGLPIGTLSEEVYYYNQNGEQVARVHQFTLPDGSLAAGGSPDPKALLLDGVRYRLHRGADEKLRSPELRFSRVWMRRIYGFYRRRIKCPLLGR